MSTRLSHPQVSVRAHTGAPAPAIAIILLAAALAGLALLPAAALAQRVDAASRPTIVLVHGAWAGPAGWEQVVAGLDKDGYATSTPTLGLQSSYADVAIVQATLDTIPGDKILVGHSYGGSVISQAAAGRTDVLGLVYTAAFVPDAGETLIGLGMGYQPPAALQPGHLVFLGAPFASPVTDRTGVLPGRLRGGPEPEAGVATECAAGPDQLRAVLRAGRTRRMAHPPVVVRRVRPRPHGRPGVAARPRRSDRGDHCCLR